VDGFFSFNEHGAVVRVQQQYKRRTPRRLHRRSQLSSCSPRSTMGGAHPEATAAKSVATMCGEISKPRIALIVRTDLKGFAVEPELRLQNPRSSHLCLHD
jgi:hypothetical protein